MTITNDYVDFDYYNNSNTDECWRVPLKGEYPGYINASFVNVRIMHTTLIVDAVAIL